MIVKFTVGTNTNQLLNGTLFLLHLYSKIRLLYTVILSFYSDLLFLTNFNFVTSEKSGWSERNWRSHQASLNGS